MTDSLFKVWSYTPISELSSRHNRCTIIAYAIIQAVFLQQEEAKGGERCHSGMAACTCIFETGPEDGLRRIWRVKLRKRQEKPRSY